MIPFPDKKYSIIYADPPWKQDRGGKKSVRPDSSGMELPYQVCSLEEIETLMSKAFWLGRENNVLFLWTIDKYLFEAQAMAEKYGYKLHARMIWNKVTGIPAAFTIRFGHEYLLYMYHGKLLPVALEQRGKWHSVFTEQVKKHSQKPEIAYQLIESLYPNTEKFEMFARQKRQGWDVWGNEV
jgi:N6-adenosine-specific RNA methylase IME4